MSERINEICTMSQRKFSALVDKYIRGTISEEDKSALESPELLMRMYLDLISTEKGLRGQYAVAQAEYDLAVLDADGNVVAEDKALRTYRECLRPKQKFSLGLYDTMAHVGWLVWKTYPKEFGVIAERDSLIAEISGIKKALEKHRKNGLQDPEGFLEREEELWNECANLIGQALPLDYIEEVD